MEDLSWKIHENPIKVDDLGVPLFWETSNWYQLALYVVDCNLQLASSSHALRVWLWLLSEGITGMDAFLPQVFSWVSENGMYLPNSQLNSHLSSGKWWLPNGSWGPLFLDKATGVHTDQGHSNVEWMWCFDLGVASEAHYGDVSWIPGGCAGPAGVVASAWRWICFFMGSLVGATIRGFPTWSNCAWKFHAHNVSSCFIFIPFNKDVSGLGITRH